MKIFSRIISGLFSPFLAPTYGLILAFMLTELKFTPLDARIKCTAVVFVLTCLVPIILILGLVAMKHVDNLSLSKRAQRTVPYLMTLCLYTASVVYMYMLHAPSWLEGFMVAAAVALLITLTVNCWWKISAHMASMGGLTALLVVLIVGNLAFVPMFWPLAVSVVVSGLVGTARLALEAHTPAQLLAGYMNGFICVLLFSIIL